MDMEVHIKLMRLTWLGYVTRMENSTNVTITYNGTPEETIPKERSRLRWRESVKNKPRYI